ncbi:hypothetical protein INT43_005170 [Umbelopsis isabellina]|uniref:DASH complex subunit DAD1 n=1 Tax=Mortierella isabellina TaxID=91625 RepID=A0A8H7U8T9_MORIS|nr:hypothetical protein INT43_005170 [Umbelopsis isabellina]
MYRFIQLSALLGLLASMVAADTTIVAFSVQVQPFQSFRTTVITNNDIVTCCAQGFNCAQANLNAAMGLQNCVNAPSGSFDKIDDESGFFFGLLSITLYHSMDTRPPFERERDNLLENVTQGLEQVIANMAHLNRNLETINTIGKDFDNVASLWREFHSAIVTDSNVSNGNEEHRN